MAIIKINQAIDGTYEAHTWDKNGDLIALPIDNAWTSTLTAMFESRFNLVPVAEQRVVEANKQVAQAEQAKAEAVQAKVQAEQTLQEKLQVIADKDQEIEAVRTDLSNVLKYVPVDTLSAEELAFVTGLYPELQNGVAVKAGEVYRGADGKLYEIIQDHTPQADWVPAQTPALYKSVTPDGTYTDFVQPTGAHDAYQSGDRVIFENGIWESLIDNNAYSPTAYPQGWKLIE